MKIDPCFHCFDIHPMTQEGKIQWLLNEFLKGISLRKIGGALDRSPSTIKRYKDGDVLPDGNALKQLLEGYSWVHDQFMKRSLPGLEGEKAVDAKRRLQRDLLELLKRDRENLPSIEDYTNILNARWDKEKRSMVEKLTGEILSISDENREEKASEAINLAFGEVFTTLLMSFSNEVTRIFAFGRNDSHKKLLDYLEKLSRAYSKVADRSEGLWLNDVHEANEKAKKHGDSPHE